MLSSFLQELLESASPETVIVSVGDLVNKGPDSRGCLVLARERGVIAVRGNHEEAALK